ncbi:hypothetical protein QYE76_021439 [Lolium multiflorum]|uniref:DUF7597 domain-containing protein n=1 Tax=Lolium multiflorum TaxID=4521 RepID=A0AAD8R7P8_LOLMU|nr:hypothetical protein QYE76_021439 [Lolium multiflorum]
MAMKGMDKPGPRPIVKTMVTEGKKLNFAEAISYPACKGYKAADTVHSGVSQPADTPTPQGDRVHLSDQTCTSPKPFVSDGSCQSSKESSKEKEKQNVTDDLGNSEQPRSLDGLDEVIDDIAYRFWECGRCLSMGHDSKACTKRVRCRFCFRSGHFRKTCLDWLRQKNQRWVPKVGLPPHIPPDTGPSAVSTPVPGSQDTLIAEAEPCPCPTPPPADSSTSVAMANFELNPSRWVPHGFHIIDGGPTRLPRTFYNATVAPAVNHGNFCVAQLNPPPQQQDEIFWRDIIRDFIVNHHQRAVENMQPCLFGVGLFQLRSPASVAALVQQQPFEIADNVLVRFVHHNNRNNHRLVQGARRGWIMVLGIPFDYRNDYDISNAVAAFGKFHHWHQDDVFKERTMIYITFDSPASVPRDIVFGNYANIGDLKETWTAPCYVMGADFVYDLPADEDQMPPDGNPHPLPGNLVAPENLVVLPPFPQLGWNNAPLHGEQVQHEQPANNDQMQQQEEPQEQPVEEVVNDSIVVDLSVAEGAYEDLEEGEVNQPMMEGAAFQQLMGQHQVLHVGMVHIGPMLPPHMIIERLINMALPHSFFTHIPKSPSSTPFKSVFVSEKELLFKESMSVSLGIPSQGARRPWRLPLARRHVATLTECDDTADVLPADNAQDAAHIVTVDATEGNMQEANAHDLDPLVFSATPIKSVPQRKRGRPRKSEPAVVDTAYRRSTRSCTNRDGHRPVSMSDTVSRPKKKIKLQKKSVEGEKAETPVYIMQRVGVALGIDADLITEEKLKADSKDNNSKESPNDS